LFARSEATVVICDIADEDGRKLTEMIQRNGGGASYHRLDVSSEVTGDRLLPMCGMNAGRKAPIKRSAMLFTPRRSRQLEH
jgi:hypothetical protein